MIEGIGIGAAQESAAAVKAGSQLDKNAFTQLLVAQLQNQDPMSPQSNDELAAQLAQFSSLEQMELVNQNLVGLARLQQGNASIGQITSASALVGQNVAYTDEATGELVSGAVEYAKIEDGRVFLGIGGVDVPIEQIAEILGEVGDSDDVIDGEDTVESDGDDLEAGDN